MKAVIIGGVAAGMSAASRLRRRLPGCEITVYERGGFLSYGACGLPYYIGGLNDDPSLLIARTRETFTKMGIDTHLHCEITRILPDAHLLEGRNLETGEHFQDRYDTLMIAVGCNAAPLRIPGADSGGVFYLRTMEDGLLLHEMLRLPDIRRAVIIGGGYIGCEMAEALRLLGREVTLIEAGKRILSNFEPEFSELAAQSLEANGVRVLVGTPVTEIAEGSGERIVRYRDGNCPCDIVLVAAGVVPATDFLKDTGISMARNGAVLVDRQMRTNLDGIFAAGDCAAVYHRIMDEPYFIPLGTNANKCGRIAGSNMAGGHETFPGALGTAALKVFSLEMGRCGLTETDCRRLGLTFKSQFVTAYDHPAYYPHPTKLYIKLLYEEGTRRLLGANVAGEKGAVLRLDLFALAIHNGMTTDALGMVDLAYAPPFAGVWDAVHIAANAAK